MTSTPDFKNMPSDPHVICFATPTRTLVPCRASSTDTGGIDTNFAIYATRHEANANIPNWQDGMLSVTYFTVPACILFDTVETPKFVLKGS